MKKYYIQFGVGTAKYLLNFHDGIKKHDDGSEFFDCRIFKNKKYLKRFVNLLKKAGYELV